MRTKFILFMLLLSAASMTIGNNEAGATSVQVGAPGFNFSLNDYQPAPPNVHIHNDGGRPYYIEHDRRVYMEKKGHKKYKKQYKKHYKNKGHKNGHGKH